jgi:hypothetical protein
VSVKRAYRNSAGTLTEGSTIAAMAYDGTNRRVSKTITNSGDWGSGPAGASEAVIYNFYHDGQLVIEVRDM